MFVRLPPSEDDEIPSTFIEAPSPIDSALYSALLAINQYIQSHTIDWKHQCPESTSDTNGSFLFEQSFIPYSTKAVTTVRKERVATWAHKYKVQLGSYHAKSNELASIDYPKAHTKKNLPKILKTTKRGKPTPKPSVRPWMKHKIPPVYTIQTLTSKPLHLQIWYLHPTWTVTYNHGALVGKHVVRCQTSIQPTGWEGLKCRMYEKNAEKKLLVQFKSNQLIGMSSMRSLDREENILMLCMFFGYVKLAKKLNINVEEEDRHGWRAHDWMLYGMNYDYLSSSRNSSHIKGSGGKGVART